jgi:hypothetical protein
MKLRKKLLLGVAGATALAGLASLYIAAVWPYNSDEIITPRTVSGIDINLESKFHNQRQWDLYFTKWTLEESDSSSIYEVNLDPDNTGSLDPRITRAYIILNREEGNLNGDSSISANVDYYISTNNLDMITETGGSYRTSSIKTSNASEDIQRGIVHAAEEMKRVIHDKDSRLYRHLDGLEQRANSLKNTGL